MKAKDISYFARYTDSETFSRLVYYKSVGEMWEGRPRGNTSSEFGRLFEGVFRALWNGRHRRGAACPA